MPRRSYVLGQKMKPKPSPDGGEAPRCTICEVRRARYTVAFRPGGRRAYVCQSCRDGFKVTADRILGEVTDQ